VWQWFLVFGHRSTSPSPPRGYPQLVLLRGCRRDQASGAMLSYRKSLFQERMILMEFAHGMLNIQGRVLNTSTDPRRSSPGNYRDSMCRFPSPVRIRMVFMVTGTDSPSGRGISLILYARSRGIDRSPFFPSRGKASSRCALNCMHQRIQSLGRIGVLGQNGLVLLFYYGDDITILNDVIHSDTLWAEPDTCS
jgi:hypothetical protein